MPIENLRILVVDDFPTMRRIIRNLLKQSGHDNVVEADDGSVALEVLRREEIDLVIADWHMPNLTGIELLRSIRRNGELSDLKVFMVSAESKKDNILEAEQAGVNDYIVKPFAAELLQKKIEEIFGK